MRSFGVAPLGASGMVWPKSEYILAAAAKVHNIPYTLSSNTAVDPEHIRPVAGDNSWFQLYTPKSPEILQALLERCQMAGYDTILLSVDAPGWNRR